MFVLVLLLIVVPILELYVIIKVGGAIGVLPTLGLLLLDSFVGAALLRHQGRAAWRRFRQALDENRVPGKEVFDGAMIILGGSLLLTPGFLSDIVGMILLIPPTRAVVRGATTRMAKGRFSFGSRAVFWGADRVQDRWQEHSHGSGPRPGDIDGTAHEVDDESGPDTPALPR